MSILKNIKKIYLIQLAIFPIIGYSGFTIYRYPPHLILFLYLTAIIIVYILFLYFFRKIIFLSIPDNKVELLKIFFISLFVPLVFAIFLSDAWIFYLLEVSFIQFVSLLLARYIYASYENKQKKKIKKEGREGSVYAFGFIFVVFAYLPIVKIIENPFLREYFGLPNGFFFWLFLASSLVTIIINTKILFSYFKNHSSI